MGLARRRRSSSWRISKELKKRELQPPKGQLKQRRDTTESASHPSLTLNFQPHFPGLRLLTLMAGLQSIAGVLGTVL